MVGSGEESQLIRIGHGFDDHDYGVVKYPLPGTAFEEQVLAFEWRERWSLQFAV